MSLVEGNPKLQLSESTLCDGFTPRLPPINVTVIGEPRDVQYQAEITPHVQVEDDIQGHENEKILPNQGLDETKVSRNDEYERLHPGRRLTSSETKASRTDEYEHLHPGRRLTSRLNSELVKFTLTAIIIDAREDVITEDPCVVFLVPKGKAHEWLFSSAEGQMQILETSKAARLIMVSLDSNPYVTNLLHVMGDLLRMVTPLFPLDCRKSSSIRYFTHNDGVTHKTIRQEVSSTLTGAMIVEDVVISEGTIRWSRPIQRCFRRLIFRRNPNLIESEALLINVRNRPKVSAAGIQLRRIRLKRTLGLHKRVSKKWTKGRKDSARRCVEELRVDHSYLCSAYHAGMIAALTLVANNMAEWLASEEELRCAIIGIGGGMLPMFVQKHLPFHVIKVVELDPVVGDVAKKHFGFIEDDRMELVIRNGIDYVQEIADAVGSSDPSVKELELNELEDNLCQISRDTDCRFHVILIDTDSQDPSSGLSCPSPEFLEDKFLDAARDALFEGGALIINFLTSATAHHVTSVAQLKKYFVEVYEIEMVEDLSLVLIALPQPRNRGNCSAIEDDLGKRNTSWKK